MGRTSAERGGAAWRLANVVVVVAVAFLVVALGFVVLAPLSAASGSRDAAFVHLALQDPAAAAVLSGVSYETSVVTWGGSSDQPAGATVTFSWPADQARSARGVWPILSSGKGGAKPTPPYKATKHRVRVESLSSLRVDVLSEGGRAIQILPIDGQTRFTVQEETWAPFSWVPWFTAHPWPLLIVFIAVGGWVVLRAWRRSRAWNRKMPSLTRHDRQFIGRLSFIVFLALASAWQVYEIIRIIRMPIIDPGVIGGNQLTALPMLIFSPAVLVAALVLEFSLDQHRVAWGLVAVLSVAGSLYNLATAVTGVATNANLSSYILLAVAGILAAQRAFPPTRTGWSRGII